MCCAAAILKDNWHALQRFPVGNRLRAPTLRRASRRITQGHGKRAIIESCERPGIAAGDRVQECGALVPEHFVALLIEFENTRPFSMKLQQHGSLNSVPFELSVLAMRTHDPPRLPREIIETDRD